jgi:hypothetical protein
MARSSASSAAPLGSTPAARLAGGATGRLGGSGYDGSAPGARRGVETIHGTRRDLALGCHRGAPGVPPPRRPPAFSRPCRHAGPSRSARCRSTAAGSSPPSKTLANSAGGSGSSCRPARPNSTTRSRAPNATPTEEFYKVTPCALQIAPRNPELLAWERTYNTLRPHPALGYRTPQEFLAQCHPPSHTTRSH